MQTSDPPQLSSVFTAVELVELDTFGGARQLIAEGTFTAFIDLLTETEIVSREAMAESVDRLSDRLVAALLKWQLISRFSNRKYCSEHAGCLIEPLHCDNVTLFVIIFTSGNPDSFIWSKQIAAIYKGLEEASGSVQTPLAKAGWMQSRSR